MNGQKINEKNIKSSQGQRSQALSSDGVGYFRVQFREVIDLSHRDFSHRACRSQDYHSVRQTTLYNIMHYLTEPVQAAGLRDFDPFSTYPALPYPSEDVDRLVSFCQFNSPLE